MRISDWSSDVCSSDLLNGPVPIGCVRIWPAGTWQGYTGEKPEASIARIDACGLFRTKETSRSPFGTTSLRLWYQILRGFWRSLLSPLSRMRSHVHLTSAEVKGLPSCHLTPWRSLKVNFVASSDRKSTRLNSSH